jgi:hypothetical protein
MTEPRPDDGIENEQQRLDPGAYIGQEPEFAADRLPVGVQPGDERASAHDSAPGVRGETGETALADDRGRPSVG